jgi:RNA polymerase sigma-32 factor
LAHAVRKFDSARGVRLVTYANYWIRAYILDYVTKSWSIVTGAARPRSSFRIRRERARAVNILGEGEAADALAAERLGMTPDHLRRMLHRLEGRDQPLDTTQGENDPRTPLDTLSAPDDQERSLSDHQLEITIQRIVRQALSVLDSRERFIIERRLMADRGRALALADIGRCLGVSPERARQLEARAKRKLRSRISAMEDNTVSDLLGRGVG